MFLGSPDCPSDFPQNYENNNHYGRENGLEILSNGGDGDDS